MAAILSNGTTQPSIEQVYHDSNNIVRPVSSQTHRIFLKRNNPSNNKVSSGLSDHVPQAPDARWIKKILSLDRKPRLDPAVAPSLRGRQQAPTSKPSRPNRPPLAVTGPRPAVVDNNSNAPGSADRRPPGSPIASEPLQLFNAPELSPSSDLGNIAAPAGAGAVVSLAENLPVPLVSSSTMEDASNNDATADVAAAKLFTQDARRYGGSENEENRQLRNAQKEQFALRHVYMVLEHCMKDYERTVAAVRIEMEDYKGSRRISVTCYAAAVEKARVIEAILFKAGKGLQGFSFVVQRNKQMQKFGFKARNSGLSNHSEVFDGAKVGYSEASPSPQNRSNQPALQKRGQPFSNTPYWTPESTMVEIFCADRPDGDIAAAPIRMEVECQDGSFATCTWTCGGIVQIDGVNYGLTTAHPFVLCESTRLVTSSWGKQPSTDSAMPDDFFDDDDPLGRTDGFFSAQQHPKHRWQAVGKVSHHALAKIGFLPCNNDWLLFELPKDRIMWANFERGTISSKADHGQACSPLAIFTAHGILDATLQERTAFLIIGDSPFEVMKLGLDEPLRPGDSGSWLMQDNELVGVVIAGSEEHPGRPVGYAISAQEVYRSISTSMGGLSVRSLTALENAINARSVTSLLGRHRLAVRCIRQLFDADAPVGRIKTLPNHYTLRSLTTNLHTSNDTLTALLTLGFFCLSLRLHVGGLHVGRPRRLLFTRTPFPRNTKRTGEKLYKEMIQLSEGQEVAQLIVMLSTILPRSATRAARATQCSRLLLALMDELNISPLPAGSQLQALVESTFDRSTLSQPVDSIDEPTLSIRLARSLGRAMFAIRTHNFFVYEGLPARHLEIFLNTYSYYPVIVVHEDFKEVDLVGPLIYKETVPRIYLKWNSTLPTDRKGSSTEETKSRYDSDYGDMVEFEDLDDLLETGISVQGG